MRSLARYDYVLFDLDGTLSKSAEGIRYSIEKTVNLTNAKPFDFENYSLYIGPPLLDTFTKICQMPEKEAHNAVEVYRKIYDKEGKYINKTYDGVPKMLRKIKEEGISVAVASSKYEKFVEEILDYLKISQYIDAVCGSTLDGKRKDKEDIIPYALNKLGAKKDAKAVMIGDTHFDCIGAKKCGIDFIGVKYGYGSMEKMRLSGGEIFAETPAELLKFLL
ncbi:MAG: HAD hydrolase-like protein [Acutalibacteraceae bacterium]